MEKKITWLHFSDLHYGQKGQSNLWPKIKKELFKDLEFIKDELGKIDIVFFSGDLTQSGKKEEFDELTALLNEMWSHFKKIGSKPYFIAIPGNHDLTRPDQAKAVVKVLKNYQNDKELKESFWEGISKKNENYDLIHECFKNFNEWYKQIDLPKPNFKFGLIPGDISTEVSINGILLKIVGLNTAFLQISNEDYLKKIVVGQEQVITLTSANPLEWIEKADIALLITHHDPSWYDKQSSEYYENDINPDKAFYSHLCGDLHNANTFESGTVGSELRRIQLAPSLFGLQKKSDETDRIHGYYAGSYTIKSNNIYERFYPRKALKQYDGNYAMVADNGFKLDNRNCLEFAFSSKNSTKDNTQKNDLLQKELQETKSKETISVIEKKNILDLKANPEDARELDRIPKVNYLTLPQHLHVRLVEQRNFVKFILKDHFGWLITDWGLDEAGFIGSISQQLGLDKLKSGFVLNCEDIVNEAELISAFEEQFGMALQRFCNIASGLDNSLLVLDHLNTTIYASVNSYHRFIDIIKSITDFCPKMYIVIIARQTPKHILNDRFVKLAPLDESDIMAYLNHHLSGTFSELNSTENLVKLLDITSGLPKHIDRIVDNLKVVSFEEILEAEKEPQIDFVNVDQIPKSLKQVIDSLDDPSDKVKQRSLKLLKILTVLFNGETAGNLRKFDGTKPIHIDNATMLEQLSLVEVITINKILSNVNGNAMQQIKILRVPRQIRDYVYTLITEDERETILKLGCEMYFGNNWRTGAIKNIYSSVFGTSKFLNTDNCHLITNNLMANAIKNDEDFEIERAANLAINFCDYIYHHGDYKNAVNISEEIYNWLKPTNFNRLKATNAKLYGAALRMAGNSEKSTLILNEALQMDEVNFSNSEKNTILFDLAFTYVKEEKFEKAIECSKIIEKTAKPNSVDSIQVKFIHARSTLTGAELIQRLKTLEHNARKANSQQLANTISLHIASLEDDSTQNQKRYSKILASEGDDYNRIRALISKSLDQLNLEESLPEEDLHSLSVSYSYLYIQRLEVLFKKCHKALWIYCIKNKRIEDLLNLFKHSSLIWRISGETELEKEYFKELKAKTKGQFQSFKTNSINIANINYYVKRELEFKVNK